MNPSTFYEQIYNSLGKDFQAHLEAGDLYLYKLNDKGELTKKKFNGRLWARMSQDSIIASTKTATVMILDKINTLQQTNNFSSSNITFADITNFTTITALFEIVKIAAAQNGRAVSEHIANYGLTDSAQRFEIAKIAAAQNEDISQFIANYNLTETQRFELAKIAASRGGWAISKSIANYNLTETQRFEIAKIAALRDGGVVRYIDNYNLMDPALRFEIAKIIAVRNGEGISRYIDSFRLTDPHQRFEIAKIAAAQNGGAVSEYITRYAITDPAQRFEIAKIAAAQDGWAVSAFIDNYGITDPAQRFEIAKIAAAQNGEVVSEYIDKFGITDPAQRFEIAQIIVTQVVVSKDFINISSILNRCLGQQLSDANLFQQFPGLHLLTERELTNDEIKQYTRISPFYKQLSSVIDEICTQRDSFIRKPLIQCLGSFLLLCQLQNISPGSLEKGLPIIKELFSFREPEFRFTLISSVVETIKSEEGIAAWKNLFNLTENRSFTPLICMFLAPLTRENSELVDIIKTRAVFQDTHVRNPFIKNLERLANEKKFSLKDKQSILSNFILCPLLTADSLLKNAHNIAYLLALGEAEALKTSDLRQGLNSLNSKIIEKRLGLGSIENFAEKFLNSFGTYRQPDAIFRYAATLANLGFDREQHMNCLREFTGTVLEETFPAMRYSTDNNIHLQIIFGSYSGEVLKEKWKKGAKYEDLFTQDIVFNRQEKIFECVDFFRSNILNEKHLPENNYPELLAVLSDPNQRDEMKQVLNEKLKADKTSSSPEDKKNDLKIKRISSFQLQAINLMYPDTPLSNKEIESKIKGLLKALNDIYKGSQEDPPELSNDLKEEIRIRQLPQATRQVSQYDGWTVIDTDNPCDLLLVGTEVSGSCLNIDGDSEKAKCLLSNLIDGKNRALVVKDKEGKIIARTILRLLWDEAAGCPILFQEIIYPKTSLNAAITTALNLAAKRRATELHLPLLSATPTDSPYPNPVLSLGGRAPSENVDAGPGKTGNSWSLTNMFYVL